MDLELVKARLLMFPAVCVYSKRWTQKPVISGGKVVRPQSGSSVATNGDISTNTRKALSKEDDAKLVFGTIFSLRNMVKRLGGDDDRYAV